MVRLRSLGECVIDLGGVRVGPESEVLFALLLYLVVERGHRVPRARLIELLWPFEADERARHNLRQALYKAKHLGAAIAQEGSDVVLPASEGSADYDALVAEPGERGAAPALALEATEFLPSYDGGLSDALAEWVEARRAVVHSMVRRHLAARIARARRLAQWAEVERLARDCLALDPLNEEAVIGLAEATAVTGSRTQAVGILDRYLAELGADAKLLGRSARELRGRIGEIGETDSEIRFAFVGRDEEIATLSERLIAAFEQRGSAIVIHGSAGIGKSTLLQHAVQLALVRGASLAMLHCKSTDQQRPLALFSAMAAALLRLPGALGIAPATLQYCNLLTSDSEPSPEASPRTPQALNRRIREAIYELVCAISEEAPLVIAIEDSHWADDTSIAHVAALAHEALASRVMLLITSRVPLTKSWRRGADTPPQVIELQGLSDSASLQLLSARAGRADASCSTYSRWCLHVADGHPLFLRELGDHWRAFGECYRYPSSLSTLLSTRVDALSAQAQRALQYCAVLARDSTLPRLEALVGVKPSAFVAIVEELEKDDVVVFDDTRLTVRHELLRQEVLRRIRPATKRALHLHIARLLDQEVSHTASPEHLWACAQHWILAGERARSAEATLVAATRLLRVGLPEEAARILRTFLADCTDQAQRLLALELLASAERDLGRWSAVLETSASAGAGDPIASLHHSPAELHRREALYRSEGLALPSILRDAEHCAAEQFADPEHRLQAAIQGLVVANDLYDLEGLTRLFIRASAQFPLTLQSDVDVIRLHLIYHALVGDLDLAVALAHRCVETADRLGNPLLAARCLRNAHVPLRLAGQHSDAIAYAARALEISERTGIAESIVASSCALAVANVSAGNLKLAGSLVDETVARFGSLDPLSAPIDWKAIAATVALFAGNVETAAHLCETMPTPRPEGHSRYYLERLALNIILFADTRPYDRLKVHLADLQDGLVRGAGWGSCDTIAAGVVFGLVLLGDRNGARSSLQDFVRNRRERYPLPAYFAQVMRNAAQ